MQDPDEKEMANTPTDFGTGRAPRKLFLPSQHPHPVARRYYRVGLTAGQGFESDTRSTSVVGPDPLQPSFVS